MHTSVCFREARLTFTHGSGNEPGQVPAPALVAGTFYWYTTPQTQGAKVLISKVLGVRLVVSPWLHQIP